MNNNQIELLTSQLQATLNTADEVSNLKIRVQQQLEKIQNNVGAIQVDN
jgi:hypothetical protein